MRNAICEHRDQYSSDRMAFRARDCYRIFSSTHVGNDTSFALVDAKCTRLYRVDFSDSGIFCDFTLILSFLTDIFTISKDLHDV